MLHNEIINIYNHQISKMAYEYIKIYHQFFPKSTYQSTQSTSSIFAEKKIEAFKVFLNMMSSCEISLELKLILGSCQILIDSPSSLEINKKLLILTLENKFYPYATSILDSSSFTEKEVCEILQELKQKNDNQSIEFIINNYLIYHEKMDSILKIILDNFQFDLADIFLSSGANLYYKENIILKNILSRNNIDAFEFLVAKNSYATSEIIKVIEEANIPPLLMKLLAQSMPNLLAHSIYKGGDNENIILKEPIGIDSAINQSLIILGEDHGKPNCRLLIIDLIKKNLIKKIFLEMPICEPALQYALGNPVGDGIELDPTLIEKYVRKWNFYEFYQEYSIIDLVRFAYKQGVEIYFHDVWP